MDHPSERGAGTVSGPSEIDTGIAEAGAACAQTLADVKEGKISSVPALTTLWQHGAPVETLLSVMNQNFAVVRYGDQTSQTIIAAISGKTIRFMKTEDFHKMFANFVIGKQGRREITLSNYWFGWKGRRQYLGRGVAFEPGGPLEVPNDMLNMWRGFAITPKPGDWPLLHNHIRNVLCSGNQQHYQYLIRLFAYRVQHLDRPTGVAVAFLGPQGAGKGVVARTFGSFFGEHFAHINQSDHLTGRFNATLAKSLAVFLDEAVWAADKKGEGILKALITEPTLQLEAKFRDPIMMRNLVFVMIASNEDWAVPVGVGDRRSFVLKVADTYSGPGHKAYWDALYTEIDTGGAAAMLHDLLAMDLSGFDVRAIPHTAAKAHQQVLSLRGPKSWLHHVLQEGAIGADIWQSDGLIVSKDDAYNRYEDFSKRQREYKPTDKSEWSKIIHKVLGTAVQKTRPTAYGKRVHSLQFAPLSECRDRFTRHLGAADLGWEEPDDLEHHAAGEPAANKQTASGAPVASSDGEYGEGATSASPPYHRPSRNDPLSSERWAKALAQARADGDLARRQT
jgi:hypothetical protein